jgi:predicted O-methyltransferase YrrM
MDDPQWRAVDSYIADRLAPTDDILKATLEANARAGLPPHDVSPLEGKLLHILARAIGAKKILEIGTLGGYSTICLARALPPDGKVVTLESNPKHASVARANLEHASLSSVVELRIGPASETLPRMKAEGCGPFDLIFIDADKPSNPEYLKWSLQMSRPGTLIIGDNVVRGGAVADSACDDPSVVGVRQFIDMLATDVRVSATAIQTVGCKGYDGFAVAIVGAD